MDRVNSWQFCQFCLELLNSGHGKGGLKILEWQGGAAIFRVGP